MEIKNARFVISSSYVKDCPSHGLPEYAFIGRDLVYSRKDDAYQSFFGR